LKELKKHPGLRGNTYFNVFTVDSYQGEENDIILLSLVRSNDFLGIGFLESKNRLVVALSRARRGLYLFGNAITLTAAETSDIGIGRDVLWTPVISFMKAQGRFDLDGGLPITCSNHGTTLEIREADDWLGLAGGCDEDCVGILPCGHNCPLKCHHFEHSIVICRVACPKILACGHGCSHYCGEPCECSHCEESQGCIDDGDYMAPITDQGYTGDLPRELTTDILDESDVPTLSRLPKYSLGKGVISPSQSERYSPKILGSARNSDPGSYDLMPGDQFAATRSCKSTFMSSSTTSLRSGPGMPYQWQNWDAKKSDAEMAEKARLLEAEKPRVDASKLVYNDTWRPATVENGVRFLSGPERKVVPRLENNDQSPARGVKVAPTRKVDVAVAKTSDDDDIADIIAQMTGFSFSKSHPVRSFTTPELASTNVSDLMGLELFSPPDCATHAPSSDYASPPNPINSEQVQDGSSITLVDNVISSTVDGSRRGIFEAKSPLKDTSPKAAAAEIVQNENLIDLDEADPPPAVISTAPKVFPIVIDDLLI
jgi:helicase required for RNAi-mediated heterochromatin assembly 1